MSKGGMRWGAGRPSHKLRDCDTRAIDVRRWQREGLLKSLHFGWQWTDSDTGEVRSSISVYPQAHGLSLSYAISGQPYRPFIATTTTPCHFGGSRVWFTCPGCSARCARLFLRWGRFRCRACNQITYRSQREDQIGRLWLAQAKIEARLGQDLTRPKFMRLATFERLRSRFWQLEHEREMVFSDWAERFREWL